VNQGANRPGDMMALLLLLHHTAGQQERQLVKGLNWW